MSQNMIAKTVQRSNTYMVLFGIIGIVIAGVLIYFQSFPYFYGKFAGPFPITPEEILEVSPNTTYYFREVTGESTYDTGYYEYTYDQDTGRTISTDAWFGAILLGQGRWMLVRNASEIDSAQQTYVGGITKVSGDVAVQVLTDLEQEFPNVKFVPVMLDVVDSQWNWYVGTAVVLVLLLLGLYGLLTGMTRMGNPKNHPTMKRLARIGNVDDVIQRIESDLIMGDEKVAKLQFTRNYLIHKTGSNFDAMPYSDVVWLYKMVQSGRYGKTYQANFCDLHGHMISITAKENQVDEMLRAVMQRAPWALAGYTDDVNMAWNKDRQQLLAAVAQRKAQLAQQSA